MPNKDLFDAVSRADRRRVNKAKEIINQEVAEWLRHKPAVTKIIKLVEENPGMFFLSTPDDALNAALDYLKNADKNYRKE